MFDGLRYFKKLRAAGVSEAEAEVHAETMAEIIKAGLIRKYNLENYLATKQDIYKLQEEIRDLRREIKNFT
jgi:hypothetical protein